MNSYVEKSVSIDIELGEEGIKVILILGTGDVNPLPVRVLTTVMQWLNDNCTRDPFSYRFGAYVKHIAKELSRFEIRTTDIFCKEIIDILLSVNLGSKEFWDEINVSPEKINLFELVDFDLNESVSKGDTVNILTLLPMHTTVGDILQVTKVAEVPADKSDAIISMIKEITDARLIADILAK